LDVVGPFKFHIYNFDFIFKHFGSQGTYLLKTWIDNNYRIIKAFSQLQFLKHCKLNNVIPIHIVHHNNLSLNIYHHKAIRRLKRLRQHFEMELLRIEIFVLHKRIHYLNRDLASISGSLHRLLSDFIWESIKRHHFYFFNRFKHKLYLNHRKKYISLQNMSKKLALNDITPIKYTYQCTNNKFYVDKFTETTRNTNNPDNIRVSIDPHDFKDKPIFSLDHTNKKWFLNLSNSTIPTEVSTLLQMGDRFSIPIYQDKNKKTAIHEFIKDVESDLALKKSEKQTFIRNMAIPQLYKFLKSIPSSDPHVTRLAHLYNVTKRYLQDNPNIIFTKADKGNITVALEKCSYIEKVEELLKDVNTYTVIKKNPTKAIENTLNNTLKIWLSKDYISKSQYFKLRSSDSNLPRAYGLPKVHKESYPYRIIVSSINTALYSLSSFLQDIIAISLEKNSKGVANSLELYNLLSGKQVRHTDILISLDVTSLFTNVPLDLVLDSISKRWPLIQKNTKISKNEFVQAIKFIFTSTFFIFNKVIYKQTFGTPMGSPLSPVIADIVMRDLETYCLNSINCQLTFYYRYVDDIVMAVSPDNINLIFDTFNSFHDRIKFTIEYEESRSISFLDFNNRKRNKLCVRALQYNNKDKKQLYHKG